MRKIFLFAVALLAFVSCAKGPDYPDVKRYWGVGTLDDSNSFGFKVALDNGKTLIPAGFPNGHKYEPENRDRLLLDFEVKDGYSYEDSVFEADIIGVALYAISDVIYKGVGDSSGVDSLGNDPIIVQQYAMWVTDNLLNVPLEFNYNNKTHSVNLVCFQDSSKNGVVHLELRHNARNDGENKTAYGYKCFDLNTVPQFAMVQDSVKYKIIVNKGDYLEGVNLFNGVYYKPKQKK